MLDSFFTGNVELSGWESLVAKLTCDNESDLVDCLKRRAWDIVRGYEYDDAPDFGDTYTKVLLDMLEAEIRRCVGFDTVQCEAHINGRATSFEVTNQGSGKTSIINNHADWQQFLNEQSGNNRLDTIIADLMDNYSNKESETLAKLHAEGRDSLITDYVDTKLQGNEDIAELDVGTDYDNIAINIQWAIAAAIIIKELIEECRHSTELEVSIISDGITINVAIEDDEFIELKSADDLYPHLVHANA